MNPNDTIRRDMLQWFYDRNSNATSKRGKTGSAVKISDLKKGLKDVCGLKGKEVQANLTYLVDRGWVNIEDVRKEFTPRGSNTTIPQVTTWYEISAKGIDKIEGGSEFEPRERYAGININATGSNVITLGDGNVVNADFRDLHSELNDLKEVISASASIGEAQKLDAAVDIESIKDQLAKSTPNKGVVRSLWDGVKAIATAGGAVQAAERIGPLIGPILG